MLARLSPLTGGPAEGPSAPTGSAQQAGNSALRAPAAGVIRRVGAKVGDVAAAVPLPPPLGPEPAFSIIVGNELEVEADVLSLHLAEVKVGQLARMRLDSGRELAGRVRTILPEIDHKTQLGKVRLAIDSDPITRAGLFARAPSMQVIVAVYQSRVRPCSTKAEARRYRSCTTRLLKLAKSKPACFRTTRSKCARA